MLSEKENYLEAIRFGRPEYVPFYPSACAMCGMIPGVNLEMPMMGGQDAFGVSFAVTADGALPVNTEFLLDDITKWKEDVKFPDLDALPWEEWAEMELSEVDRNSKMLCGFLGYGIFDRLVALMGFENGLISMTLEPEACDEFFSAVADYKVKYVEKLVQYYKPDLIQYMDDVAHLNGLFMSPETYRKLIKPHHKRIIEAITSKNIIAEQHTCGKCEAIIPDYVEMGVNVWMPAQTCNDLKSIKQLFMGKLAFNHGLDSQGPIGMPGVTEDIIRGEVRKAVENYAEGGGLVIQPVFMGVRMQDMLDGSDWKYIAAKDELKKRGAYQY